MKKIITFIVTILLLNTQAMANSPLVNDNLSFTHAFVRLLPPNVKNTAAFVNITNHTNTPINLVKVSTVVASKTEFHDHIVENELMKMVHIPHLLIKPHTTVSLKSGGLHLMLFNLIKPLKKGQKIKFTLEDSNQVTYEFSALVGSQPASSHHHHH